MYCLGRAPDNLDVAGGQFQMAIAARAGVGKHAHRVPSTRLQVIKSFQQRSRNGSPQTGYLPPRPAPAFVLSNLPHQHLQFDHVCHSPIHRELNIAQVLTFR